MASTKKDTTTQISREKTDWGIRLISKPFKDQEPYASMEISIEVSNPRNGRGPELKTRFTGVPVSLPLRPGDVTIWTEALRAITEEAKATADQLKKRR